MELKNPSEMTMKWMRATAAYFSISENDVWKEDRLFDILMDIFYMGQKKEYKEKRRKQNGKETT